MNYMFLPLKRYADFQGRSRRMEYWMFWLLTVIIGAVACVAIFATMPPMAVDADGMVDPAAANAAATALGPIMLVLGLVWLALIIPSIAVTVRRLHDQDKSGWMILIAFIPIIGGLILLVFMLLEGTQGPNQYGPDPKDPYAAEI